ncbi:hypothetical protein PM082_009291 [Marasmius tenuissimus]|nr:hypothetical protein PM082_009291 [Marasmius tenuissimus]
MTLMASRPSDTQGGAESLRRNTWSTWSGGLPFYWCKIAVFTLHAITQVVLQTTLILVGNKAYHQLSETNCGSDTSSEAFSNLRLRAMSENIALFLLQIFAWILYVYTTLHSSLHVPFVAILSATSFGSSLAQYISAGALSCSNQELAMMLRLQSARHILLAFATSYLVFWSVYWNTSLLAQVTPVTSLSTTAFLLFGMVLMAVAPRSGTPGLVLWVWLGFAAVCVLLCIISLFARRCTLKHSDHGAADPSIDFLLGRSTSSVSVGAQPLTARPSLPNPSTPTLPPTRPVAVGKVLRAFRSSYVLENHTSSARSVSDRSGEKRDSGSTGTSSRLSVFHVTHDAMREPTDEEISSSAHGPPTSPREVQRQMACAEVIPHSTPGNSFPPVEEDMPSSRDDNDTQLRSVGSRDNSSVPRSAPATLNSPSDRRPSPSSERSPPSSYTLSDRSRSPISRPSTAVSSVPPYSAGPYSFGEWRDTLLSDHTYETLPSYHSRRSTQTFATTSGLSTSRGVRSLPPIPPLPPSLSSVISSSPSFPASPPGLDIQTPREGGITSGFPEPSEQ